MPRLHAELTSSLTSEIIRSLHKHGINDVVTFLSKDLDVLSKQTSTPYKTLNGIRKSLIKKLSTIPKNVATQYEDLMKRLCIFSTSCEALDRFLDGGIYSGEITEICGPSASGKTQLCFAILSNLITKTQKTAIYFDSQAGFSAQRILEMCMSNGSDHSLISDGMKRVHHISIFDPYNLIAILSDVKLLREKYGPNLMMIIIDSISPLLSPLQLGTKKSDGMSIIVQTAQTMKILAVEYGCAIVVCNNVVKGDCLDIKPALGQYWKHVPAVTLSLESSSSSFEEELNANHKKIFKLSKSGRQPCGKSITLNLTETGFQNIN